MVETQAGFAIWITRTNDRIDQINDASESLSQHPDARGC